MRTEVVEGTRPPVRIAWSGAASKVCAQSMSDKALRSDGFRAAESTPSQAREPVGKPRYALRRLDRLRSADVNGSMHSLEPSDGREGMTQKAIVGKKVGMTQVWDDENRIVPVTVVEVAPCRIVQIRTVDTHGYAALQVTTGERRAEKMSRPEAGHFAAAGVAPGDGLVELRLDDVSAYSVGQELTVELFEAGEVVDVVGTSKGKGFTGVMKRHNFAGQRATHGAHLVHRMPGSVGQCATPSRVFKGQRMAGHSGNQRTTTQNLTIVEADAEKGLLLVKGALPGARGGQVVIRNAAKVSA